MGFLGRRDVRRSNLQGSNCCWGIADRDGEPVADRADRTQMPVLLWILDGLHC